MGAVLGGLGAAAFWAVGLLCASRATRHLGSAVSLAWIMLIGLVAIAPVLLAEEIPPELDGTAGGWLVAAGGANVAGLGLIFTAYRLGKVSIIAPIASAEGAFAAVIAVLAGEHLAALQAAALSIVAGGIALAATSREDPGDGHSHAATATVCALLASALFGFTLYATARASDSLPVAWVLLPARLLGAVALALPLALAGRLRLTRAAAPLVGIGGLCEVFGLSAFAIGSREGVAVTAVIGSQFAALAVVAAFFLFRERLARMQLVGVATTVAGVAVLSALRA